MDLDICENEQQLLPPSDLEAEIRRLQEELMNERDRNLRTHADFKNYRRRIERDGNKIAEEGKGEIIIQLLDIIDDMEKALQWATDENITSVEGMKNILRKLHIMLERQEVLPFESVGMLFDHNYHNAVAMVKQKGSEPGIIVDELRRGYLWKKQLLRPAQVRVAG